MMKAYKKRDFITQAEMLSGGGGITKHGSVHINIYL